jgi:hypothetical protein
MSKRNFKVKEKLVTGPRWAADTRTYRLTVGRKLTNSLTPCRKEEVDQKRKWKRSRREVESRSGREAEVEERESSSGGSGSEE